MAAKRQKQLERSKGFANVMQCLTTCNKPIVGHNMLLDLAYLYQQFIGTLPPTLDEFRAHVSEVDEMDAYCYAMLNLYLIVLQKGLRYCSCIINPKWLDCPLNFEKRALHYI